jgi:hypothetical protein
MTNSALETFIADVRSAWGPLASPVVAACRRSLAQLTLTSEREPWLASLHADRPEGRELHRDPEHGFVLLAHVERAGLYRPPHDHGRGWVVYAVQQGEIEVRTFARIEEPDGAVRLVQRDSTILRPGIALAYLPGDIHDTRCLTETALEFRFTERDLKIEDRVEHRVTRYGAPRDAWTVAP